MDKTEMKIFKTDQMEMTLGEFIDEVRKKWGLPFIYNFEWLAGKLQEIIPIVNMQRRVKVKMIVKVQEIKENEEDSVIPAHWLFIVIRWYITGYIPGHNRTTRISEILETINGFVVEIGFYQDFEEVL